MTGIDLSHDANNCVFRSRLPTMGISTCQGTSEQTLDFGKVASLIRGGGDGSAQLSFATLDFAAQMKRTKRDVFLAEMAAVLPASQLEAVIEARGRLTAIKPRRSNATYGNDSGWPVF